MSKNNNINDFKPSDNQLRYLQAFLDAKDNPTKEKLCKQLNLNPTTIWTWQQDDNYNKWFHEQVVNAMTRSLPKIYRGMESRAMKKYLDAKLYLKRFDKDFRDKIELKAEYDIRLSEKLKKMSDEELDKIIDEDTKDDK